MTLIAHYQVSHFIIVQVSRSIYWSDIGCHVIKTGFATLETTHMSKLGGELIADVFSAVSVGIILTPSTVHLFRPWLCSV